MLRNSELLLADIRRACERISQYTSGMSFREFILDDRTYDAVLRNLTIIGEAAKQVPAALRVRYPSVQWAAIARFRDVAVHHYFGLDNEIVWDIVENEAPALLASLTGEPEVE